MVELEYLKQILPLLRDNQVTSLKMAGLEISLRESKELKEETGLVHQPKAQVQPPDQLVNIDESQLPPDLRTDNINNFDAVLNWSGTQDPDQLPLPLTGEA